MESTAFCTPNHDDDEMTPQELRHHLAQGQAVLLVDVRQPWEYQLVHLDGARLIPLGELPAHAEELDPARPIVIYCHHGIRSFDAMLFLRSVGFPDVKSLQGGIDRWSAEIDPSLPRY
jgi:rhodanese-related sulfurtransferase